jgi:hypothetical protein
MLTVDDFYESPECREMFEAWLTPESLTAETFALVRQHSAGLVPPVVLRVTVAGYCEYVHNVLVGNDVHYNGLVDHLMVELQGVFQADADYGRAATEWLEEADRDQAADWSERSWEARVRF